MKYHWLYGIGPNKEIHFNVEIDEEAECIDCFHNKVCYKDPERRCSNYKFGDSRYKSCESCTHRFTRFDNKQLIPCFHCKDFILKGKIKNVD